MNYSLLKLPDNIGFKLIISINSDPNNKLFDVSHYSIVGDLYEILPNINEYLSKIVEE